jgi:protein SCO1/2
LLAINSAAVGVAARRLRVFRFGLLLLWDNRRMSSRLRRSLPYLVVAVAAAAIGIWLAQRNAPPAAPSLHAGTWLPQSRALPASGLIDQDENLVTAERLRGQASLVFFGFSNCPDVCPTTLAQLKQLRDSTALAPLRVVMVSVDPERDSPTQLKRYLAGFDPKFVGLTGEAQTIREWTESFAVAASRTELPGGDYTMDHSATVYVLDRDALMVAVFTPPLDLERMRADLDTLAARWR